MSRWNPNLYRKEGLHRGYSENYLDKLESVGHKLLSRDLPVIFTLSHLAHESNVLYKDLHSVVARGNLQDGTPPYRNFTIRKRSGGKRWISIPAAPLLVCQSWIAQKILNQIKPHRAACAYVPGLRFRDTVSRHCGADWILKLDIKDFFGHISERQIYNFFRAVDYPELLAFELARICTKIAPNRRGRRWINSRETAPIAEYWSRYVGSLPQGAPTSPALSNLVNHDLDEDLERLAAQHRAVYTRYADDLCFSFSNSTRKRVVEFKAQATKIIRRKSFQLNEKKTQICPPGSRKIFVGLVLNGDEVSIPREYRDVIRMHLYYCRRHGIPTHCKKRGFRSVVGFRDHLFGLISYMQSICPARGQYYLEQFNRLPWVDFDF